MDTISIEIINEDGDTLAIAEVSETVARLCNFVEYIQVTSSSNVSSELVEAHGIPAACAMQHVVNEALS